MSDTQMSDTRARDVLRLYGMKISMFTGKVRSYLIKNHIPFEEIPPITEHFQKVILPQIHRRIIPVVEMPDGTVLQDTTDIIDHLETVTAPRRSAYSKDPLTNLLSLILELFGDEGLIRPAMHLRWNYPERGRNFITHGFGGHQGPNPPEAAQKQIDKAIAQFSGFLKPLGINETTIPEIERSYRDLLDRLEYHFRRTPYFFGDQPLMGDYGMMCSLYAHLGRDPIPASEMKNRAPSLFRWTERMNQPHADFGEMPYYKKQDGIPETLGPIFEYIAQYFLPEMQLHITKTNEFIDMLGGDPKAGQPVCPNPSISAFAFGEFQHGEIMMPSVIRPSRLYLLQRVTDAYDAMSETDKADIDSYLSGVGLSELVTLKPKRRIAREDYLEVWA